MKILISYYSFSGNTEKVVKIFADVLKAKNEITIQRLKPKDEIMTFGAQAMAAFTGKRSVLEGDVKFDASPYDLVVLGCPVWAFAPVPAMNTFLDKLSGLSGKKAIVLLTSGSGIGVGKCFKNIRKILESKGVACIDEVNIPDRKQSDKKFIVLSISKYL